MQSTPAVSASLPGDSVAVENRIVAGIRAASDATGVPFEYLLAQANQESGLDPTAKNNRSTATGLYQFTTQTWFDMVKSHGADLGLQDYSDAISKGRDGRWHVADKGTRDDILALRQDPELSARMAAEYAKDNQQVLEKSLGRPAGAHDLYLAHFLGAGGAVKVLARNKDGKHSAARLLPEAARANPEVFREPGSRRSRSISSLYKAVRTRFDGAMGEIAPVARRARTEIVTLRPPAEPALAPAPAPAPAPVEPRVLEVVSSPFANAIEPASPYFPVKLPPPMSSSVRADGQTWRGLIEAMDEKG